MRVWIDQLGCTGAGQCELLAPEVFVLGDDGLATVMTPQGETLPDGGEGTGAVVPLAHQASVRDAVDVCPGACIHLIDEGVE